MKNLHLLLSLALLSFLFHGCKKDDPQPAAPTNVLTNGDIEVYPFPQFYHRSIPLSQKNPNTYTVDYTNEAASSPTHSIKMSCDAIKNDSTYHIVGQAVYMKDVTVPEGSKLTMKVKLKTANIQGNGIAIGLGGTYVINGVESSAFFSGSEGKVSITGTNEFKEYTITVDSAPKNLYQVYSVVYLLAKTTGTVYVDDMSLTLN